MAIKPLEAAFDTKAETSSRSKRRALVLGAFAIAVLGTAGSVYAASININNSTAIQFGQGVQEVTTCDTTVDFAITSTFDSTATPVFAVDEVTLTTDAACENKVVDVYLVDALGATIGTKSDVTMGAATTVVDFSTNVLKTDAEAVDGVAIEITG